MQGTIFSEGRDVSMEITDQQVALFSDLLARNNPDVC